MKVYDNYEISPCTRTEEPDKPGHFYFEVCEPHEADVWTLYGHIDGEGVEAIGDFSSPQHAEQVYYRITGQPFTGSYQADARLRVMHAGPQLLEALQAFIEADELAEECGEWKWENLEPAFQLARAAVAQVTVINQPERSHP
jgi:hypothetical protein